MPGSQSVGLRESRWNGSVAALLRDLSAERANQLTHGLGLLLCLVGTAYVTILVWSTAEYYQLIGLSFFTVTMSVLFLASTLSHSFEEGQWRHRFRTLDQLCIFIFMSGAFTPFALQFLADDWWWVLVLSWITTFIGCFAKLYIAKLETLNVIVYLIAGWIPAIAWRPLVEQIPRDAQWLILCSAMLYTVGTLFLVNDHRGKFWHAAWHLFVVAATVCVFFAMTICCRIWIA